jgi:hypothetical protein
MDIQLYRRAVAEQFPQLDLSGFRLLGEGGVFGSGRQTPS